MILSDAGGSVLATQRSTDKHMGLHWEFPGGKVDAGESPEEALRREIMEELGISIGDLSSLPHADHTYDIGSIRLLPYFSTCETRPILHLTEHADACWIDLKNWTSLKWAPADVPVIQNLLNNEDAL